MRWRVVALCLALVVGACSKQHGASPGSASTAPPTRALNPPAARAPASPAVPAPSGAAKEASRPNQDGSEVTEEAAGDSGAHNALLAAVASTVAAATPSASAEPVATPAPGQWQEGVNYSRIVPAQPTEAPAGQVEVLEFFWYACPHCYALDPKVEAFRKSKPPYVTFSRVPVTWSDGHRSQARMFYTLQALGKLDQLHGEVFKEIHVNGNPLVAPNAADAEQDERVQTAWAKKEGIPEDLFKQSYHSFQVDQAVIKADQLVQRYRIEAVPTFVINGKYLADVGTAGSPERLMALVSDLAAQEHKH